jgi:uncharacterized protein (DUF2384 family)
MRCGVLGTAGSAYMDFQRALKSKNLLLIESAARELPQLSLEDSLSVLLVMAETNDVRYHRAAAKWAGRAIAERRLSLDDGRRVLALVDVMATAPHAVVSHLRGYLGEGLVRGVPPRAER